MDRDGGSLAVIPVLIAHCFEWLLFDFCTFFVDL
jgi:hypothetical protein